MTGLLCSFDVIYNNNFDLVRDILLLYIVIYLQEVATKTKRDMTSALEDTVVGQVTLNAVIEQLIVVNNLVTNASRVSLPSLAEVAAICSEINETSISDAAVNITLVKAKEGLAVAQEALNRTQQAS